MYYGLCEKQMTNFPTNESSTKWLIVSHMVLSPSSSPLFYLLTPLCAGSRTRLRAQVKARRTLPPFLGREGRYSLAIDQVASLHGRSESIRFRRRAWPGAFRNCPRGSVWTGVLTQCGCGWIRSIRHHSLHPFMSPLWTFCRPLLLSCTRAMMRCWSCLDWRSTIVVPLRIVSCCLFMSLKFWNFKNTRVSPLLVGHEWIACSAFFSFLLHMDRLNFLSLLAKSWNLASAKALRDIHSVLPFYRASGSRGDFVTRVDIGGGLWSVGLTDVEIPGRILAQDDVHIFAPSLPR